MKKVSLLLVLAFMTMALAAQDTVESGKSAGPGRTATFKRNGFFDNWFVGAGAGANIYFGGEDQHASFFGSRPSLTVVGQLGKWFNPYLGVRAKGSWGSQHSFTGSDAQNMMHQKNFTLQADAMFDVTNYLGKYNENRFYNFIVFGGVGGAYAYNAKIHGRDGERHKRSLTVNAGIINKFRLTNRLSLDIEFDASILSDDQNQTPRDAYGDWKYDGNVNSSIGLTYKIGKYGFDEAILADQAAIDNLNDQIKKLREENAKLAKRPESCPKCPERKIEPVQPSTAEFVSNVVFFRINSAVIDNNQDINIYNTAQYLKENPSAKVKVVGYADKKTGTADYNYKLSERRAKAVADYLIKKYNIASDRVAVEWKGDTVQPYAENAWNRVAIFYAN